MAPHGGVETGLPELAKMSLFSAAVVKSVLAGLEDRFLSQLKCLAAAAAVAFGAFEPLVVALASSWAVSSARHFIS